MVNISLDRLHFPVNPVAKPSTIISGPNYRFTVLTDGLLRYEWSPDNRFEDRPSVFAINRDFPVPSFRVKETPRELEIITSRFHLSYDKTDFTPSGLSAIIKGFFWDHASVWRYGEECENLGGTARTLDGVEGRCPLGPGVISRKGYTTIDDSISMLFAKDGFVASRMEGDGRIDGYLFAYGHDYRSAVKALYKLSGSQPLLPRWALGNWWSRYYAYSADEYLTLMDQFQKEEIPLSVAVLDMDWHIVEDERIVEAGKTGWTGYTWNKDLFPDPRGFLADLHKRNLKVSVNDHPADGVQSYEDLYEEMGKALNFDTSDKDPIHFDITNRDFLNAFFDVLHRPLEDDGIDFWWIDWQQGEFSKLKGIDPLWMLNHYHFLDSAHDNKRPLTFSRYAGPGSHRYPIGFSGDTVVSWASLDFQPEFTLTASNVGYGWWSHDVGGHWNGDKDDELGTRWVQFGVFSPIMRLHSSKNQWSAKEPWKFGTDAQKVMGEYLRLRHRMLPYLYSMNMRAAEEGEPLIQPMYWNWPEKEESYRVKNQYMFGTQLIVMPITAPQDPKLRLAQVKGWLPPGRFVDIFTGVVYDGDRELWISRPLEGYPVFAKEGSIVPFDTGSVPLNGADNPAGIEISLVVGADGEFQMFEDDGSGSKVEEVKRTKTSIKYTQATGTLEIRPEGGVAGDREWKLRLLAVTNPGSIKLLVDGAEKESKVTPVDNGILISLGTHPRNAVVTVDLGANPQLCHTDMDLRIWGLLNNAQIGFYTKEEVWNIVTGKFSKMAQISRLHTLDMQPNLLDAILEFILADARVN